MATYEVQGGQTIWDIATHLYGSVAGVFDLMISNPKLSMTTDLKAGMQLEYHEGYVINNSIVSAYKDRDIIPANEERSVYHKASEYPILSLIDFPTDVDYVSFNLGFDGHMEIDWGDNSPMQIYNSVGRGVVVEHWFNNKTDKRQAKVYGDLSMTHLDLSGFPGTWKPVRPIYVDSFISAPNYGDLSCLFLFEGLVDIDLHGSQISDLSSIYDLGADHRDMYNGLNAVDLTGVKFASVDVLDDYLEYLAGSETHGTRRPCTIYLDTEPSQRGYDAIAKILAEPQWNQEGFGSSWFFFIKDKVLTTE